MSETMIRPRVILHNMVSLDGRLDWFMPDIGLYYELAAHWNPDAILTGSDTILTGYAGQEIPVETAESLQPAPGEPDDPRPRLIVADSRGRVRFWHQLRREPYWRDPLALCSEATPQEHLSYLRARQIDTVIAGEERIDFRAALHTLATQYGLRMVRVDSGGQLNGVLLRAGLVDEVSVLISPHLVGGSTARSMFRAPDLTSPEDVISLRLTHLEQVGQQAVWLRYEVVRS